MPRLFTSPWYTLWAALLACVLASPTPVWAEQANAPRASLAEAPFQLEVTVLSVEEKSETPQQTNVWYRVRVERVWVGAGLKVGDETAVVSRRYTNRLGTTGTSGDRGPFAGPNGLPVKGDRARVFADGSATTLFVRPPNGWQRAERTIAFVAADDEYRSEVTLPMLADLVTKSQLATAQIHIATGDNGRGSPKTDPDLTQRTTITDAWKLRDADATVLYMRFREFDHNTMLAFTPATTSGLPLVGFRTSTHAFRYPAGPQAQRWNDEFPRQQFGTDWKFHHGHTSTTRILPPTADAAKHPVLAGVNIPQDGLVVPSWLYHVEPLPADCQVLLWGEAVKSENASAPQRQPILWVRELPRSAGLPPRRIAFTTLGHPGDFAEAEVRVLAYQMIAWAIGDEAKSTEATRALVRKAAFTPPPTR